MLTDLLTHQQTWAARQIQTAQIQTAQVRTTQVPTTQVPTTQVRARRFHPEVTQ